MNLIATIHDMYPMDVEVPERFAADAVERALPDILLVSPDGAAELEKMFNNEI